VLSLGRPGFLGRSSVSSPTATLYRNAVQDFESWARLNSKILTIKNLDTQLEKYCDFLFFDGAAPWEGTTILYGLAYTRG
jgi:hypothetical protein